MLGLGWNADTLYRLHPDEYLFFNPLVGGLAGASRNYDTDYWVNTMPEAVSDLEHYLDRTEGKARPGHHYLVAVCSERVQFEKEADSRLEWTRDVDRADFFIAPTQHELRPRAQRPRHRHRRAAGRRDRRGQGPPRHHPSELRRSELTRLAPFRIYARATGGT